MIMIIFIENTTFDYETANLKIGLKSQISLTLYVHGNS